MGEVEQGQGEQSWGEPWCSVTLGLSGPSGTLSRSASGQTGVTLRGPQFFTLQTGLLGLTGFLGGEKGR